MNHLIKTTVSSILLLSSLSLNAQAMNDAKPTTPETTPEVLVKVKWQQPGKFTDILRSNQSRANFQLKLFANFEKYFNKLARQLPSGYQWHITVTDIDLAGDINTAHSRGHHNIRVIDRLFKTKVAFSYQLMNAQGEVVSAGDEVLKENAIERFPRNAIRHESYAYEKYMIKTWFKKTLLKQIS